MARARTRPSTAEIDKFAAGIKSVKKLDPWVKLIAYGDNGSGKTRLGASFPKALILDIKEKGTRSAADSHAHKREVETWDEIGAAYWYLKSGDHPYKTIVLDTVTAMHMAAMDKVLEEAEDRDPTLEKSKPTQPIYGRAGKLMEGMLYAFRNLHLHVVFLAQERKKKDDDGDVTEIVPALPEGCRGALTACGGVIGHMRPKKVGRRWIDELYVGKSRLYKTKDRTFELGTALKKPTGPDIIRAWNRRRATHG